MLERQRATIATPYDTMDGKNFLFVQYNVDRTEVPSREDLYCCRVCIIYAKSIRTNPSSRAIAGVNGSNAISSGGKEIRFKCTLFISSHKQCFFLIRSV